jgi:hypothetical protein
MNLISEILKNEFAFSGADNDEKVERVLEVYKDTPYLTFDVFRNTFYNKYQLSKSKTIDNVLSALFYCYCLKTTKKGIGLQDISDKYNNKYFEFLKSLELKGYCNSPASMQDIDFTILSQNFDSEGYGAFKDYLFYNKLTKNYKFKFFNSLGREPALFTSYGNKIDIISHTIDVLEENFSSHKSIQYKSNVYKINFSTNLDDSGLIKRFGNERFDTLKQISHLINVEEYNHFSKAVERTKEEFLIKGVVNELR